VIFIAPVLVPVPVVEPQATKSLGTSYLQPDHETLMRDAWGHIADVTGAGLGAKARAPKRQSS